MTPATIPHPSDRSHMTTVQKIVTLRVGIVGLDEEGLGTAVVQIDLDGDESTAYRPLANAYRKAMLHAIKDLAPKIKPGSMKEEQ